MIDSAAVVGRIIAEKFAAADDKAARIGVDGTPKIRFIVTEGRNP